MSNQFIIPARDAAIITRPFQMPARSHAGPPMTLGNMRASGVRRLDVSCWPCHHSAILDVEGFDDDAGAVVQPRMVCTGCGIVGTDMRPNWIDRAKRETMVGSGWKNPPQA
jgi:hypothetical protein